MWIGKDCEGVKYWMNLLAELKNRGVTRPARHVWTDAGGSTARYFAWCARCRCRHTTPPTDDLLFQTGFGRSDAYETVEHWRWLRAPPHHRSCGSVGKCRSRRCATVKPSRGCFQRASWWLATILRPGDLQATSRCGVRDQSTQAQPCRGHEARRTGPGRSAPPRMWRVQVLSTQNTNSSATAWRPSSPP